MEGFFYNQIVVYCGIITKFGTIRYLIKEGDAVRAATDWEAIRYIGYN